MVKSINELNEFLNSHHGKSDFSKVTALFAKHQNTQDKIKTIHVAGTNGKGSTVSYIAHALIKNGYKVGMYTSPHLEVVNDRIRINDEYISDIDIIKLFNEYENEFIENNFSFFEMLTFIAFKYFYINKVDYAIIEVGLGGRLDATNVINKPLVSVITNIGYDHMAILGDTLAEIAYEKAGIIKEQVPVVIGNKLEEEAKEVILKEAQKKNSHVYEADIATLKTTNINYQVIEYNGISYQTQCVALYQKENLATALKALEVSAIPLDKNKVKQGIEETNWLGRYEKMQDKPLIYLDGAHNIHGISSLCENIDALVKDGHNVHVLFSALKDKETDKMLDRLLASTKNVTVTEFNFERCKDATSLANHKARVIKDYKEAINTIKCESKENDVFIITGSLYFVSTVRPLFKGGENHEK